MNSIVRRAHVAIGPFTSDEGCSVQLTLVTEATTVRHLRPAQHETSEAFRARVEALGATLTTLFSDDPSDGPTIRA